MKIKENFMINKYIFLALLTISLGSLNSQPADQQTRAKNDPVSIALNMVFTLYAPHKKALKNIRQSLDALSNEFVTLENDIINRKSNDNDLTFKESIEEKIRETEINIKTIAEIRTALDHCPKNVKSENAQKELAKVGLQFLGKDNPDILSTQAEEILIMATNLLKTLASK